MTTAGHCGLCMDVLKQSTDQIYLLEVVPRVIEVLKLVLEMWNNYRAADWTDKGKLRAVSNERCSVVVVVAKTSSQEGTTPRLVIGSSHAFRMVWQSQELTYIAGEKDVCRVHRKMLIKDKR